MNTLTFRWRSCRSMSLNHNLKQRKTNKHQVNGFYRCAWRRLGLIHFGCRRGVPEWFRLVFTTSIHLVITVKLINVVLSYQRKVLTLKQIHLCVVLFNPITSTVLDFPLLLCHCLSKQRSNIINVQPRSTETSH